MVLLNEYRTLNEFDRKRQAALESLLYSDEKFMYAIDVYDALFLSEKRASKLVLTNQRVIQFKRGFIKESSKDFSLKNISSIEYDKGFVMRKVTLEGTGFSNEYQTLENYGRTFVTAVREQMARTGEGAEPIETPSANNLVEATEGDAGSVGFTEKFGSVKMHAFLLLLTFWTVGLGNACYAGYRYYQFKQFTS